MKPLARRLAGLVLGCCCASAFAQTAMETAAALRNSLAICLKELARTLPQLQLQQPLDLRKNCPALAVSLDESYAEIPFDKPSTWLSTLQELHDYRVLLDSYRLQPATTKKLNLAALPQLLRQTLQDHPAPAPPPWWHRFTEWLKHLLGNDDIKPPDWLARLAKKLLPPAWLAEWLLRVCVGLLVLGALVLVANELRHSGVRRRWRGGRHHVAYQAGDLTAHAVLTLEAARQLAPHAQAPGFLRAVIATLTARGLLPAERGYTNREYLARLRGVPASGIGAFTRIIEGAEAVLYGQQQLDAATTEHLYRDAQQLLMLRSVQYD